MTEGRDREPDDDLGPDFQNGWWILEGIRHSLPSFLETLTYLGPLRSAPERFYYVAGQSIGTPEHGKHFVRNLVKAEASSRETINDWLRASRMSYRLQLEPLDERKTLYELRLQELSEDQQVKISANIREVGFGLTQMLPIVTQAVLAQPGDTLIIEQPELHLHPRAQVDLTDLFIVMARQGTHFLIETHSEHLLLRLRRCIAETHLKSLENKLEIPEQDIEVPTPELRPMLWPEDVSAYFVERPASTLASLVTPLEIDRFGDLPTSQGFADFFSDDAREILAIARAALTAEGLEAEAS